MEGTPGLGEGGFGVYPSLGGESRDAQQRPDAETSRHFIEAGPLGTRESLGSAR